MATTLKYIIQLKGSNKIRTETLLTLIYGTKEERDKAIEAMKYNYKHGYLQKEYDWCDKFKIKTSIEETS